MGNKALTLHALTTLALCYLPGVLAGQLAQDEEAVGAPHAVRRLHPRVFVCCLHVPHVPRTGVWRPCRSLCACDGRGRLGTKDRVAKQDDHQGVWDGENEVERRMLPHDRCFWVCSGGVAGHLLPPLSHRHAVLEGVCLRAEWLGVDSSCLPLCSRHVLWLALHEWSKLWDSVFLPVRTLHTIPDQPDEAAHGD